MQLFWRQTLGGQLVHDYGKYHLSARAVQEQMMTEKDYLCVSAPIVTFNDRPFVLLASLRSAVLNTQIFNVPYRFNVEISNILNPPSLAHFNQEHESAQSSTLVNGSLDSSSSPSYRSGASNPQQFMDDRLKRATSIGKVEILMSTVSTSTRARYRAGWTAWHYFCDGMRISPRLDPSEDGRGEIVLDFPTWEHRIMGVGYPGLVTRYSAIRFVHLIE